MGDEDNDSGCCHLGTRINQERYRKSNWQDTKEHQQNRTSNDCPLRIKPYPLKSTIYRMKSKTDYPLEPKDLHLFRRYRWTQRQNQEELVITLTALIFKNTTQFTVAMSNLEQLAVTNESRHPFNYLLRFYMLNKPVISSTAFSNWSTVMKKFTFCLGKICLSRRDNRSFSVTANLTPAMEEK